MYYLSLQYFLYKGFYFQLIVRNVCPDLLMMFININSIAVSIFIVLTIVLSLELAKVKP